MNTLTKTGFTPAALLLMLMQGGDSFAGGVHMFTERAPSAQDMGRILFSRSSAPPMKMRSIHFNAAKASLPPPDQAAAADAVGLPIQFAYNSAEILEPSVPFLHEVGKMMEMAEYSGEKLMVEGHTDASGSEDYNQHLSERRAAAVKNYLLAHYRISGDRLFINGRGESSPLPGSNPFDPGNRRVQFYKAP